MNLIKLNQLEKDKYQELKKKINDLQEEGLCPTCYN
ncbi:hypothetical protein HLPCO_002159 [Haloplasma contractile SSD-17B]|uniref:Uncharacterized protein n=1 Tax=Haloplasma contractile SSD-17B TaxID=1033810 RepID=U2FL35_9MOLU|nr:hypothetical protein HLPCO_002159 [Haloplasma contractile SSD-17B]